MEFLLGNYTLYTGHSDIQMELKLISWENFYQPFFDTWSYDEVKCTYLHHSFVAVEYKSFENEVKKDHSQAKRDTNEIKQMSS